MHIELTDHLRCPEPHEESFLILLPDLMAGRRVIAGQLACPVCNWETAWQEGVPDFGGGAPSTEAPLFDAAAAITLLGIEGPGGWLAFAGRAGVLAQEFGALLPDVNLVAINPPTDLMPSEVVSIIRSATWPIKTHALRGVIYSPDTVDVVAALGSVLPGLRMVGEGELPDASRAEVVGHTDQVWVVRHR
jgi:hypothetical protein